MGQYIGTILICAVDIKTKDYKAQDAELKLYLMLELEIRTGGISARKCFMFPIDRNGHCLR